MADVIALSVTGMHCGGCAAGVEKALRRAPGVTAVTVGLAQGRAEVTAQPGSVTAEQLIALVEEAGFEAALAS